MNPFGKDLYGYTEAERTIEIYFSECKVDTTMRMLLDQNDRGKKQIKNSHTGLDGDAW